MAEYNITIRLHHKGVFSKTKYSGGSVVTFENMDPDTFSYSVLMEWVKELKYDEIGGIYVQNGDNEGWTLMTDDRSLFKHMYEIKRSEVDYFIDCDADKGIAPMKQMQPHVIVRPRSSLFKAKDKNAEKRTYVTLKNINDEKKRMMSSRKKLQFGNTITSPTKEGTALLAAREEEEIDDSGEKIGLSEYLKKFATGEGEGCNEYELNRNKRVAENQKKVVELGLKRMEADLCQNNQGKAKATRAQSESDYYSPENEVEPGSDEDDIVISKNKKKVKKVEVGVGPRTRSRASKISDSCDKQAPAGSFVVEENDASTVPLGEKLKNIKSKAPGSMAAFLELQELQQKAQSESEISQSQSQEEHLKSQSQADTPLEAPKRKRGNTKMNQVHTRTEKKYIMLNSLLQPVSNDTKSTCELSSFLGTVERDFVSNFF